MTVLGQPRRFPARKTKVRLHRKRPFPGGRECREPTNVSYVGRVLRLTLLAPHIVEVILDGRQPAAMTLAVLMRPFAVGWKWQAEAVFRNSAYSA